uniref:Uncharacterized protein n=1 Tax=Rhizophora mucronata TaxID=61149 RepID=A0A2P2IZT2_RHIMU
MSISTETGSTGQVRDSSHELSMYNCSKRRD